MHIEYPTTATKQAAAIRCTIPNLYEEEVEAVGPDFPGLDGRTLQLVLDLDTRKVRDWPVRVGKVFACVRDAGVYGLLDGDGLLIKRIASHVPACVPGEDGDYFVLSIAEDGTVEGWHPTAANVVHSFWGE